MKRGSPTSIEMRLLGQLVVRIAVGIEGVVQLLKRHERVDELVVGMKQAPKPLLAFDIVNLNRPSISHKSRPPRVWNIRSAGSADEAACTPQSGVPPPCYRRCAHARG